MSAEWSILFLIGWQQLPARRRCHMFTSFFLKMLNKEALSLKNNAREIIASLGLKKGDLVGDFGSGGGYFALEFAKIVGPTGQVYAIDNQQKNLDFVKKRSRREALDNVAFIQAETEMNKIAEGSLDLLFSRNVIHHLSDPAKHLQNLKRFLKPDGRLAIIDHKPKRGLSFVALFKHHTPSATILQETEKAGYTLMKSFDFLPEQTYNVFRVK